MRMLFSQNSCRAKCDHLFVSKEVVVWELQWEHLNRVDLLDVKDEAYFKGEAVKGQQVLPPAHTYAHVN